MDAALRCSCTAWLSRSFRRQVKVMIRVLFCLWISLGLVGCRSAQLGLDQADMRETLLSLYQVQVLDNLVRTKLHYPIVQVDYSNLTGTMNQVASTTIGQTNTTTRNSSAWNATGALLRRVFTYVFSFAATASETAALTVTGQPVISTDSVYQAYVDAIAEDPDIIKLTENPLQKGEYHLIHEFQGRTWYVPADKAGKFFKLYLAVTVQRQIKVPITLTVHTSIIDTVTVTELSETQSQLEIRFKDKILNDSGRLIVAINGIEMPFNYQRVPDIPAGHPSDRVLLNNDETKTQLKGKDLAKAIAGKDVVLKNDTFVPGFVAPVPNQLEPIRSQLELQRLQQFGR